MNDTWIFMLKYLSGHQYMKYSVTIQLSNWRGVFIVIRDFRTSDTEELYNLKNNIDTGYEIDDIKDIPENSPKFIVYEHENIKVLAYATISANDEGEIEAQIRLYVEPQSRLKGIGTDLYNELVANLIELNPDLISAYMRVDIENPSSFCNKLGFNKWWGSPELLYKGNNFPDVDLEFVRYEDKYFEQYVKVVQESYYDLHKTNDLKPYTVSVETVSKYKLSNKQNVYLALENDQIMASVTIGDGTIDNLMVSPNYQGKGYGKKALQFGMNEMISQGYDEIRICYMEGNTYAEKLYYSLGFKPLQNTHVYRKLI